jgi:hypothetical protein
MLSSLQNVAPMLSTFTLLPSIFHPMSISAYLPTSCLVSRICQYINGFTVSNCVIPYLSQKKALSDESADDALQQS